MVVNLIGPIAVGKSTFAKWFIKRNKEFQYFDIAKFREKFKTSDIENWNIIKELCKSYEYSIVESNGLHKRMYVLWDSEKLVKSGIYTVKLLDNVDRLQERIMNRASTVIELEDEILENRSFELQYSKCPANLVVWKPNVNIYPEIEGYIRVALNKLKEKKEDAKSIKC